MATVEYQSSSQQLTNNLLYVINDNSLIITFAFHTDGNRFGSLDCITLTKSPLCHSVLNPPQYMKVFFVTSCPKTLFNRGGWGGRGGQTHLYKKCCKFAKVFWQHKIDIKRLFWLGLQPKVQNEGQGGSTDNAMYVCVCVCVHYRAE